MTEKEESVEFACQLSGTHPVLQAQRSWTWSAVSVWCWELSWAVGELWRKGMVLRMKLRGMKILWLYGSVPSWHPPDGQPIPSSLL